MWTVPVSPETLLVEFVVFGIPVSAQTGNRQRKRAWQADVARAAATAWGSSPLLTGEIQVRIVYFQEGGWQLDLDNMAKPIADAITGVVWQDDKQLLDQKPGRRPLRGAYVVAGMSPVLAAAFVLDKPFVYVRIDRPTDLEILP